jgi:hypothetical protein
MHTGLRCVFLGPLDVSDDPDFLKVSAYFLRESTLLQNCAAVKTMESDSLGL